MLNWIATNKEWLFEGGAIAVPIAVLTGLGTLWRRRRQSRSDESSSSSGSNTHLGMRQHGGKGSTNIQSAGDIQFGQLPRRSDENR